MVSFEIFVKSMPPSLSELKVTPSFCFAFKIPDDMTASILYTYIVIFLKRNTNQLFLIIKKCHLFKLLNYDHSTFHFL